MSPLAILRAASLILIALAMIPAIVYGLDWLSGVTESGACIIDGVPVVALVAEGDTHSLYESSGGSCRLDGYESNPRDDVMASTWDGQQVQVVNRGFLMLEGKTIRWASAPQLDGWPSDVVRPLQGAYLMIFILAAGILAWRELRG